MYYSHLYNLKNTLKMLSLNIKKGVNPLNLLPFLYSIQIYIPKIDRLTSLEKFSHEK